MHGAAAKDLVIKVPPGTIVRARGAAEDAPPLYELLRPGDRARVASGGRGGRGNLAFKSARNNAPAMAEFGEKVRVVAGWVDGCGGDAQRGRHSRGKQCLLPQRHAPSAGMRTNRCPCTPLACA